MLLLFLLLFLLLTFVTSDWVEKYVFRMCGSDDVSIINCSPNEEDDDDDDEEEERERGEDDDDMKNLSRVGGEM